MEFTEKDRGRFAGDYMPEPTTGCWLWTAGLQKYGYGGFSMRARTYPAHRISWLMHRGAIGDKFVLHKCDTPACVNPEHLFLGTQADNIRDMDRKGRGRRLGVAGARNGARLYPERLSRGEKRYNAVLTDALVREIRLAADAGEGPASIGRRLHLDRNHVSHVIKRRSWRHVTT